MTDPDRPNLGQRMLEQMENMETAIASLTGLKAKFVQAGWSERGAEEAVVALLNKARSK